MTETLSDKEVELEKNGRVMYWREDVKEFIKKLKDSFVGQINKKTEYAMCKRIDKLAGDKLI